jgi:hypothetical protein
VVERVEINTAEETSGPTLEESAKELGILDENGNEVDASAPAEEEAPVAAERPEHIPEKFWDDEKGEVNVEALAKSYSELEKAKSSGKEEEVNPEGETAEEVVNNAGLNFDALSSEFAEKGELSEASYKSLEDAGIPKSLVDQYIKGQQAVSSQITNSVYSEVGGQETYEEMVQWAADTFEEGEIDTFNSAVTSGDRNQMLLAVKGLKARYEAEADVEPETQITGNSASTSGATYESMSQLLSDMNDPKYHNDPAFRSKVEQKLARSDIM